MSIKIPIQKKRLNERGVTLLLAILILASILSISFSLTTILFVEVGSSGDLLRTEPAIYAANAGTEQSLYLVKRSVGASTTTLNTIGAVSVSQMVSSITDPISQYDVLTTSNSFNNTLNKYPIYKAGDPYDTAHDNYSRMKITFINTGSTGLLHIYICQFDPNAANVDCSSPTSANMIYRDTTPLIPGQTFDSNASAAFDTNLQQEVVLFSSAASGTFTIQMQTYDSAGNPLGIPYIGETAVNTTAFNAGVSRSIRTIIPNPDNAVTQTASLTVNGGQKIVAINVGSPITYTWSSINSVSGSSYYIPNQNDACGNLAGVTYPWIINSTSGTLTNIARACESGTTYTITFKTNNPSASPTDALSSVTLSVN